MSSLSLFVLFLRCCIVLHSVSAKLVVTMQDHDESVRQLRPRLRPVNYSIGSHHSDHSNDNETSKSGSASDDQSTSCASESSKGYGCPECDRRYSIRQSLHAHRTIVHNINPRHVCRICGKVVRSRSMLSTHERRHSGLRPFQCQHCDRCFISTQTLNVHLRTLHFRKEEKHQKQNREGKKTAAQRAQTHRCTRCGRCFTSRCHLTRHERSHTKERPFRCDRCPKAFARRENLKTHTSFVHEAHVSFECEICGRGFASEAQRGRHRSTHDNARRFRCSVCDKCFRLETSLANHTLLVHIKQTDHRCTLCGKCFLSRTDLDRHWTSHRIGRAHWCEWCDKSFTRKCSLDKHVASIHLRNTGYVCEHCGRCVDSPSQLETHRRVHTGERPFACRQCGKSYKRNAHLTQHVSTAHRKA